MQGTRHRWDKGADLDYQVVVNMFPREGERRERPREEASGGVVGACVFRTRVKRRKASAAGKSAAGDEARYASELRIVVATGYIRSLLLLTQGDLSGVRASGSP